MKSASQPRHTFLRHPALMHGLAVCLLVAGTFVSFLSKDYPEKFQLPSSFSLAKEKEIPLDSFVTNLAAKQNTKRELYIDKRSNEKNVIGQIVANDGTLLWTSYPVESNANNEARLQQSASKSGTPSFYGSAADIRLKKNKEVYVGFANQAIDAGLSVLSFVLLIGWMGYAGFALLALYRFMIKHDLIKGDFNGTAKRASMEKIHETLNDVRGIDEIKEEVLKYVDFLIHPEHYRKLGARLPRGVLLYGDPGCGKTMLARAIANEAGVPFFTLSGSDFSSKWMGVGVQRVKEVFAAAGKHDKAVIFIDEIDSVGARRSSGDSGATRDNNATLNALLVAMDGFDKSKTILLIGATNRIETLDPALLRPGRLDAQLHIPLPDRKGRKDILELYARKLKIDTSVALDALAASLTGYSGAMIEGLLNEAAIVAARGSSQTVKSNHIESARLKMALGAARPSVLGSTEKHACAIHELGHALAGMMFCKHMRVEGVSVLPRGPSLGQTWFRSEQDKHMKTAREIRGEIVMMLGGRAAEEVIFGEASTGAADDLARANEAALQMTTRFGMGKRTGLTTLPSSGIMGSGAAASEIAMSSNLSSEGAKRYVSLIKDAGFHDTRDIINECYAEAVELILGNKERIEQTAHELVAEETLSEARLLEIFERSC